VSYRGEHEILEEAIPGKEMQSQDTANCNDEAKVAIDF
jgi:hypothetical protein